MRSYLHTTRLAVAFCAAAACLPAAAQSTEPPPLQLPPLQLPSPSQLNDLAPLRSPVQEVVVPGTPPLLPAVATDGPCAMPVIQASDSLSGVIAAMQQQLAACQRDAVFLANLGHLLLAQGRYLEASDHLERALMFQPDLQAAQLDYAIALAGTGDALSSVGLIADLLKQPGLPPLLREALLREQTLLSPNRWVRRLTVTARAGHDSNLFGAPNLSSLVLTTPSGPQERPISDGAYVSKAGAYLRSDLQLELARDNGDGSRIDVVASTRGRTAPSVSHSSSVLADVSGEYSRYAAANAQGRAHGYYVGTGISGLYAQAGIAGTEGSMLTQPSTRYTATGLTGGWSLRTQLPGTSDSCRQRVALELQKRRYISSPQLSGTYAGAAASWSCAGPADSQWLVATRYGHDTPEDSVRAGGRQSQASLRVVGFLPLAQLASLLPLPLPIPGKGGLLADMEVARYRDAVGYSPLLENDRRRQVDRTTARLEYQLPLVPGVQWALGAEWVRQRASLVLFRNSSTGPYTSLRVTW